jgi:chemotaxis receptor (MCP) glutamine deamidase CheD
MCKCSKGLGSCSSWSKDPHEEIINLLHLILEKVEEIEEHLDEWSSEEDESEDEEECRECSCSQ